MSKNPSRTGGPTPPEASGDPARFRGLLRKLGALLISRWTLYLLVSAFPFKAWGLERASVTIRHTLEESIGREAPGHGPALAAQVARLIRWRGDVTRVVHPGDKLTLVYSFADKEPQLQAIRYAGTQVHLEAYLFTGADHIARFFDAEGARVEPELLNSPVPNYVQITEIVQHGRGKRPHRGIDLKAPEGTPIISPYAGTVKRINWHRRLNGRCIEILYDDGHLAHFLHLARLEHDIRPGLHLSKGRPLGAVGSTGHSSAAHLHYEILKGPRVLEPLIVHGRRWVHLSPRELPSFRLAKAALLDRPRA